MAVQTVLYISPMELGDELQVRQIHDRFPVDALEDGIGIEQLAAFIGSGFYALELTVADGDFQEQFHRFLATPESPGSSRGSAATSHTSRSTKKARPKCR